MSLFRSNLPPKARSVIVQYALFRWENAVVVGGTLLLTVFSPVLFPSLLWLQGVWPLLGLLGVGGIFASSVTNERANAQLLLKLTQAQYDLRQIQMPELRQNVESALEYQRRIEGQVRPPAQGTVWTLGAFTVRVSGDRDPEVVDALTDALEDRGAK